MVCDYVRARRKVKEFIAKPVTEPIKEEEMTKEEVDIFVAMLDHWLDESKAEPAERAQAKDHLQKKLKLQKMADGGTYNPDLEGYTHKRYEAFAHGHDHEHGH